MTVAARYLICRAGAYPVAVRTQTILRVWQRDEAISGPFASMASIDLRRSLLSFGTGPGFGIAFEMPEAVGVVIVDGVSGMKTIAEAEFVPLPRVFSFACGLFDGACRSAVEGGHPLRLRPHLDVPEVLADQASRNPL
ncbi:MAG: hypothetical protein ACYC5H_01875 [Methylovirgula sp.]